MVTSWQLSLFICVEWRSELNTSPQFRSECVKVPACFHLLMFEYNIHHRKTLALPKLKSCVHWNLWRISKSITGKYNFKNAILESGTTFWNLDHEQIWSTYSNVKLLCTTCFIAHSPDMWRHFTCTWCQEQWLRIVLSHPLLPPAVHVWNTSLAPNQLLDSWKLVKSFHECVVVQKCTLLLELNNS